MIAYGDNIKIFTGNSNPVFAETICKELGVTMGQGTVKTFADGEVAVKDHVKVLPGHLIALDKDLFAKDALVFENDQVHMVALCDETRKPFVEVAYDAPVIGIWSPYKEGCPFVCIEPWYGRCDSIDFRGTLEERAWGNSLAAGEEKKYSYTITIL